MVSESVVDTTRSEIQGRRHGSTPSTDTIESQGYNTIINPIESAILTSLIVDAMVC